MDKINQISGRVMPLAMDNIDTDMIIPAQFLTRVDKAGYGEHVFQRLRDQDPQFPFNLPQYQSANILVAQDNFGCGSSREHAVWALKDAGIEVIIATGFADIFFNNSGKNGLVLITQPQHVIESFLTRAASEEFKLSVDLETETIAVSADEHYAFSMNPFHRHCFRHGLDQLDYLLDCRDQIEQWNQTQSPHAQIGIVK